MTKNPVIFQEDRTFGDLIGAPFQFVFQEFKNLFGSILKYSSPFLLLALIFFVVAFRDTGGFINSYDTMGIFMILGIFSISLGVLAMTVTFYSYVSLYAKLGKGSFTINDVGVLLKKYVFKVFGGMFLLGLMIIPISFIALIPYLGILIAYCGIIYLYTSLSFFSIIIVNEDESVGNSFSRSFDIIKGRWWFTFGIYLVFGLIIGFASYIVIIPLALVFGFAFAGIGASVVLIIFAVFLYLALYLILISLQHSLVSFVYFKLKFQKEGPDLMDRIDNISADEKENEIVDNNEPPKDSEKTDDTDKNRFDNDDDLNRFKPKY